jgi:hypothetical protein
MMENASPRKHQGFLMVDFGALPPFSLCACDKMGCPGPFPAIKKQL